MLQPKRTKFRKMHKMKMKGLANRGSQLAYGSFGIKAMEGAWITARQIEAARIAVTRYMKREGQVWIKIFQTSSSPRNPAEVRHGVRVKVPPEYWVAVVKTKGLLCSRLKELIPLLLKEALRLAGQNSSTTKFVVRRSYTGAKNLRQWKNAVIRELSSEELEERLAEERLKLPR